MASAMGLIRVISNSELSKMEKDAQTATEEAYQRNNTPLLTGIAAHVNEAWENARDAKNSVLWRLQRAHRARVGEYDPEKLAEISAFGGSTEYARVTANKIRIVEAWLRDVFLGQTDRPWTVNPTPKPNIPPDAEQQVKQAVSQQVAQAFAATGQMPDPTMVRAQLSSEMNRFEQALKEEAKETSKRMENKMADQLEEGGFHAVMADFLADLATYPSAILKGPIMRRRKTLQWETSPTFGSPTPKVESTISPDFERVDPFRFYPAPGAESPQEGYCIEHHTFSHSELYDLIGVPGYDEEAIRAVIREGEYGGLNNWLGFITDGAELDSVPDTLQRKVFEFDALEYHGPISGKDLLMWGLKEDEIDDPEAMYECCVWMIGKWVIKAQINYDPIGQRPYYSTSYEEIPGEFWGFGIPDVLDDVQGVVNAAVRSLVNNMGMASGPQVGVNIDRLAPDQDITTLTPWHIWQLEDSQMGNNTGKAIEFFQPQSNAQELVGIIEKFYQLADDFSLVPRYMAGSDKVGGAGRTASGLSMLMDAANKGLKGVVSNVDTAVLTPMLTKLYNHNMMYDKDPTIKGDAQVVARGAVSLMRIETMQLRRNEFLQVTANPFDMQITGLEGRSEVLRSVADGLELNTDKIVPPEEDLRAKQQEQAALAQLQQGQQGGGFKATGETLQDGSAVTDNFSPNSLSP